jgi:hypothetical protein
MALLIKNINGLAYSSIKSRNGLAVASIKSINGLDATAAAADVAIDSSAKGTPSTGGTFSETVDITVASNSNRLLIVLAGAGDSSPADRVISGVSSTLGGSFASVTGASVQEPNWCGIDVWYLVAPAVGTHTVTMTYAGSVVQAEVMATSLYNVNQSAPFGTVATSGSSGTSSAAPSVSATLATGELLIGGLFTDSSTISSFSAGTSRQEEENIVSDTAMGIATNTGTGTIAITAATADEAYAMVGIPVKPA